MDKSTCSWVSIHAPTGGATASEFRKRYNRFVSIHAPTGGATVTVRPGHPMPRCFNPRPYGRGDATISQWSSVPCRFQSTPLREGRQRRSGRIPRPPCFNPRPYGRGDITKPLIFTRYLSFNPRPYGRGDGTYDHKPFEPKVSIHAPTGGATSVLAFSVRLVSFNPRPYGRGDNCGAFWKVRLRLFQSTPLREGRQ